MSEFDLKRCMEIDGGKCVTRDGRPARVICTDAQGDIYEVVALVEDEPGGESVLFYMTDGSYEEGYERPYDLLNLPRKTVRHEIWSNVYSSRAPGGRFVSAFHYSSEAEAQKHRSSRGRCLETIKIYEWEAEADE